MKMLVSFFVLSLLLASFLVNAANAQEDIRKVERITIPYTAANADRTNPEYHSFPSEHIANWLLTIDNKLVYDSENPGAKVVLRLREDPASEKYVEIAMFGEPSKTFWLAVANEQVGYMRLFENENAWFEGKEIRVSYIQNDRLSVSNGQRNVMDRFRIGPFVLGTFEVFGKDSIGDPNNTIAGEIVLDIISGNPLDNPIMILPAILAAVAGGVVLMLVKIKKRT